MGTTFQLRTHSTRDLTRRVLIPLLVTMSLVLSQLVVLGVYPAKAASPSLSLEQCANGPRTDPRLPCQFDAPNDRWITGNLNHSRSQYNEDDAVAFRYVMDDLTPGETYTVYTNWDVIQNGKVAYDYLVGWSHSEFADTGGPGGNGLPTDTTSIPDDPRINNDSRFSGNQARPGTQGGPRAFAAWGATLSPVSSSDYFWSDGASATANFPASTTKAVLPLTFTAESSSVIIAFGGHISARFDWPTLETAAGISGSSYHMRLNNDGEASQRGLRDSGGNAVVTGQRDVQLMAQAVELLPSLDIAKTVDGGVSTTIAPGDDANYVITVTNSGNAAANDVTVTDTLDLAGGAFTVTSVTPSQGTCAPAAGDLGDGDTLTCELGTVATSSSATVTITVQAADFDSCGTITNSASVTSTEEPEAKGSGEVTITVDGCDPALSIVKTVDDGDSTSVAPGDSFTYVLTVTNDGDATATADDVVVTDTLDLGGSTLSVSSVTPSQGTCSPAQISDGTTLSCSVGDLTPGDSATITLVIDVADVDSCGAVDNVAFAVADNHEQVSSNTVDVDIEGCFTLLEGTKTLTDPVDGQISAVDGETATFELSVTNDANATLTATGVTISDTVPDALVVQTPVNWSHSDGSSDECDVNGQLVECGPFTLAPGQTVTATVDVVLDTSLLLIGQDGTKCGVIDNTASFTANEQNIADATDGVEVVDCEPDLTITKLASAQTVSIDGGTLTYTITAANDSAATATAEGITIVDELEDLWDPSQITASYSVDGGIDIDCDDPIGSTVTCGPEDLAPGSSMVATITVVASPDGVDLIDGTKCHTVDNTAELFLDGVFVDDASADDVDVAGCAPDPSIDKSASDDEVDIEGGSLTYTITASNASDATATAEGVTIVDELASLWDLSQVDANYSLDGGVTDVDCDVSGSTVTCGPEDLAPGDEMVATITVVASPDGVDLEDGTKCGTVDNTATLFVAGDEAGAASADGVAVTGCDVVLDLDKVASTGVIDLTVDDPEVTYTITASNHASATETATGVVITDTLPALLELSADATFTITDAADQVVTADQVCDNAQAGDSGAISCTIGSLAPGDTVVVTVPTVLTSVVDVCGELVNGALIDADQLEAAFGGDLEDPDAPATATVIVTGCVADITFEKTVDEDTLTVGSDGQLTYTLLAENGAAATSVVTGKIFDEVPDVFAIVAVVGTFTSGGVDTDVVCDVDGQLVECATPQALGPGDAFEVTITVELDGSPEASQCDTWTNAASFGWVDGQGVPGGLMDSVDVTVDGCEPDIALDKTAVALLDADGLVLDEVVLLDPDGPKQLLVSVHGTDAVEITYLFEVTNTGNVFLHDVEVDDPLLGGPITLSSTTLAPGESATGSATYTLDRVLDVEAGEVVNVATATGSTDDGEDVTDTDDELVEVLTVETGIALEKLVDVPVGDDGLQVIEVGEDETATLTYTYIVTNIGTDPLTDLTLVDDNLPGVDLTAALNEAAAAAFPELAAELGTPAIPPGGEVKVTAVYEVTEADVAAGQVTNVAIAGGVGDSSGEQVEADDTVTVDIIEVLEVVLEQPEAPAEPEPAVEARALPKTGVDGEHLFAIGILLAALGAATLLFTPRRRRTA